MKKLIAIVLSVAMLASCIPMTVFADEPEPEPVPEEQEIKIVNFIVSKIVENEKFRESFYKAYQFIDDYQDIAKRFVEEPAFREQYTDYLDNMIGDLDDILVILSQELAKDADEHLKDLIEELKKIREDLVQLQAELVGLIDDIGGNIVELDSSI